MGKHLPAYRNNDQPESIFPGCMWGIFYALDYHHWHNNIRKMLPRKRDNKRKNGKCNKNSKKIPGVNGTAQKLKDAEASHFFVNRPTTETNSTQKRSLKARIKLLVAEKIRKEDDNKKRGLNFPALLQLERTLSVKHVESPKDGFSKTSNEWKSPIIFFPRKTALGATKLQHPARMTANDWKKFDMCTKENLMDYIEHQKLSQNYTFSRARETSVDQERANLLMKNASRCHLKKYVDVLELFQVNEDLFQEFQQRNVGIENRLHMPNDSTAKARLTKSGTFPVANVSYSRRRNFKPTKLKDKQTEQWSFPGGVKLRNGPQDPEVNSEVVVHWEDERQRLEHQNKVHISELGCTSNSFINQVLDGSEPSRGGQHMSRIYDTGRVIDDSRDMNSCDFTNDSSVYNLRSSKPGHRRTSSLNDSMHRYVRLCDHSFSMKSKSDLSKSVRLTNEYDISATRSSPISFKRNHSLPHGNSSWPLQDEEESHEIVYPSVSSMSFMVGTTATDNNNLSESKPVGLPGTENLEECLLSAATEENLLGEIYVEKSKCSPKVELLDSLTMGVNDCGTANMDGYREELDELTDDKSSSYNDLQVTCIEIDDKIEETSQAIFIRGRCSQQEFLSPENLVLEGSDNTYNYTHERESPLHSFNSLDADFVSQSCGSKSYNENDLENPKTKNHIHTKLHTDDDADLNYAREILKVAGFNKNGFSREWYLSEQPLSPLIFDEVEESWWPHESECSQENLILLYHHQLLFDLINEVMLHIYETSSTYYPRALSTSCQVHPLHSSSHEDEVLKHLSKYIVHEPELDPQLDDPVPRDLAKADGWMNLQVDSECVALELEDFIFDELLEELICS